jgi:chemotaxis protein MotB
MSKKGHHGGAWKVAYADFVTAMMALFMVLWLTSQDQRIKEAVERAFRNPFSSVTKDSVGIIPSTNMTQAVKNNNGNFDSASAVELKMLRQINQDLLKSLHSDSENESENPVKLDLTDNGLCINVFDRSRRPIFEAQSTKLTTYGEWVFDTLAWEIARYTSFAIELEGHTESGNPPIREDYGDWELSVDRANTVRRRLTANGVSIHQVSKVAGYGDTVPMPNEEPTSEMNRRVTVLLNIRQQNKDNQLANHD